jgi:hypothetical protein
MRKAGGGRHPLGVNYLLLLPFTAGTVMFVIMMLPLCVV